MFSTKYISRCMSLMYNRSQCKETRLENRSLKYLIINGSPHKGNTFTAAIEFKSNIMKHDTDAVFDEVHLKDVDIPFCSGCYNCFFNGEQFCPHKNVAKLTDKIKNSDFLIVLSPVYSLSLSALLKNFIDHMSYNYHRPSFYTKKALVISSTAGAGASGVTKYVRDVLKFWGFNRVFKFAFRSTDPLKRELSESVKQKIAELSSNIVSNLKSGKLDKPSIKRVFIYNAWRAISAAGKEDSADKRFWVDNDMSERVYHKSIKIGLFKKLLGKFAYCIFMKMM